VYFLAPSDGYLLPHIASFVFDFLRDFSFFGDVVVFSEVSSPLSLHSFLSQAADWVLVTALFFPVFPPY